MILLVPQFKAESSQPTYRVLAPDAYPAVAHDHEFELRVQAVPTDAPGGLPRFHLHPRTVPALSDVEPETVKSELSEIVDGLLALMNVTSGGVVSVKLAKTVQSAVIAAVV